MRIFAAISLLLMFPVLMVLKISMTLLGYIAVAMALPWSYEIIPAPEWKYAAKRTVYDDWTFVALPKWAHWCWGSDKYGARGNWFWPDYYENTRSFRAMYHWLALRNSCGNLDNYFPGYTYDYDHADIAYVGTKVIDDNRGITGVRFTWNKKQPWRAGLTVLLRYGDSKYGVWWRIGYKQTPAETGRATAVFATMPIPHPLKRINS